MRYQPVKGCEDYYPQDFATREAVFNVLRRVASSFGFQELSSPLLETSEILTKKSGVEIRQQLFNLEKKGSEELALRFDLTVPMARMFVAKQKELPKPVKWFAIDRMYRYEAPQKGRLREFYQLSVELFGTDMPEADAEIINLALDCLRAFGLTEKEIVLKVNNRKLLEGLIVSIAGKDELEGIVRVIDKRSKVSDKEFIDALLDLSLDQEQAENIRQVSDIKGKPSDVIVQLLKLNLSEEATKGLEELEAVIPLLPEQFVLVDLSLARGLAYYTGNVFEVFDAAGELRSILGGGRYDNLVELFGGNKEAATGFAIGYSTLSLLLEKTGKLPNATVGPDYYIAALGEKECAAVRALAARIRNSATVDIDLLGRKLEKQLKYANAVGAKKLIVLGPQELASGIVKVKDMQSGKEETKSLDSF